MKAHREHRQGPDRAEQIHVVCDANGQAPAPSDGKQQRDLPPGLEPLLGIQDVATILSCSRRMVERMRSSAELPRPDLMVGRMPRWQAQTIRLWIDERRA